MLKAGSSLPCSGIPGLLRRKLLRLICLLTVGELAEDRGVDAIESTEPMTRADGERLGEGPLPSRVTLFERGLVRPGHLLEDHDVGGGRLVDF